MMLGLRYGSVRFAPSHPDWGKVFLAERSRLSGALSDICSEIEHVGSTAVVGLMAKPILDIAVGVPEDVGPDAAISALQLLGYEYRGDAGDDGGHVLVRESEPLVRTHHVHVVDLGSPEWEAYILFRDHLRQSSEARDAYVTEKLALGQRYPEDHRAYGAAKDEIVRKLLAEARRLADR